MNTTLGSIHDWGTHMALDPSHAQTVSELAKLPISRDREQFLLELLRELSGTLEDVVGVEEASGFISIVGSRIGEVMNNEYKDNLGVAKLDLDHLAAALVDLKDRIGGGFTVEHMDEEKIILKNSKCPFGGYSKDRDSLCMMTSNVFGKIASENNGYAGVSVENAIAKGSGHCRVIVYLTPQAYETRQVDGQEYFKTT